MASSRKALNDSNSEMSGLVSLWNFFLSYVHMYISCEDDSHRVMLVLLVSLGDGVITV